MRCVSRMRLSLSTGLSSINYVFIFSSLTTNSVFFVFQAWRSLLRTLQIHSFFAVVARSRAGLRVLLLMHLRGVVPLFGGGHFWRLAEHGQQG